VEILVSGSSAALLSREIATALRGRAWEVPLYPFSFEETLRHQGLTPPKPGALLGSAKRSTLERAFLDYLAHGGFPEAQGLDPASRHQLLGNYVDVAILRDVVERHNVANVAGLRWMVRHLLGNAASLFSVEKFYAGLRSQGIGISRDTIHQLLAHLEDCFLVRTLSIAADSEKKRMVNLRKAYPVDSGLIPIFDLTGRRNLGHALETAVLIELERRGNTVGYVKTAGGREVDFLARRITGERQLIQVCAELDDPETFRREIRALEEAAADYPDADRLLLTLDRSGLERELPAGIAAKTTYEWMLEEPGHLPTA
jgi:predicted AAA+ superfamily ATPase